MGVSEGEVGRKKEEPQIKRSKDVLTSNHKHPQLLNDHSFFELEQGRPALASLPMTSAILNLILGLAETLSLLSLSDEPRVVFRFPLFGTLYMTFIIMVPCYCSA